MDTFYKLARPDGWDFFTGKTINYRENIGKEVRCPNFIKIGRLCSSSFIHASRNPNDCFVGAEIPCSAYLVKGYPILEDKEKCGFEKLFIVSEMVNLNTLFGWNYDEAINPINPFKIPSPAFIGEEQINLLKEWASVGASVRASVRASVWDSVRDSVWDSVGASVWASVEDSVWDSVGDSVWDSVRASVGDSVWDSVWDSVRASVGVYIGSLFFSFVKEWKYILPTGNVYPFLPAVELWRMGVVSSFDGRIWRLHGQKGILGEWIDDRR